MPWYRQGTGIPEYRIPMSCLEVDVASRLRVEERICVVQTLVSIFFGEIDQNEYLPTVPSDG